MSGVNPVPVEVVQTVRRFVAAHRERFPSDIDWDPQARPAGE